MEYKFRGVGTCQSGAVREITCAFEDYGNVIKVTLPKRCFLGMKYEYVTVESEALEAHVGDEGYIFFPTDFDHGFVMTHFREIADTEYLTWLSAIPVCGIGGCERAAFIRIEGQKSDARFAITVKDGKYGIYPRFELQGEQPEEDLSFYIYKMPYATYSDMARVYRKHQMDVGGCKPLRDRCIQNEPLRRAAEAMEIRVRMGWKPIPTPIRHQNEKNEPPLHVTCTVEALEKIIDKLKVAGIEHAELCLVGWGMSGHDGRFPQQYPSDPRYGGDDELRRVIAKATRIGYQMVCHTVSIGAYTIADNFDIRDLAKRKNERGEILPYPRDTYKYWGLNGGEPYALCPRRAYERYAKDDLPVVRGYGFIGMHYVDELTAYVPEKCEDPDHPVSRRDAQHYYQQIAKLCKNLFGGYQSEGIMDYMAEDVDAILYSSIRTKNLLRDNPLFEEGIPFWQLVYHGIIMSNPTSETVNYTVKEGDKTLTFVEYGGRPAFYFNSKFGPGRNWMGDIDLYCDTDEHIDEAIAAIKEGYDEYEQLKHLQYEFMDMHEKLSDTVYRTTFSDGTAITVDYAALSYTVAHPDGSVSVREIGEKATDKLGGSKATGPFNV